MLINYWGGLSYQQKQILRGLSILLAFALLTGLIIGLLTGINQKADLSDHWQSTEFVPAAESLEDFELANAKSHWYMDASLLAARATEEQKKSIEGSPEAFKLIGIVDRKSKKMALFLPSNTSLGIAGLKALGLGDTLIGSWKLEELTASKVVLRAEPEGAEPLTKEIRLYGTQKN